MKVKSQKSKVKSRGVFITFEGPEGSGKSTHAKLLYGLLKRRRIKVIYTREPGGTKIGEKIREILLNKKNTNLSYNAELLLYMASRAQIMDEVILKTLAKGYVVICDRFQDATVAYQGYGAGLNINFIDYVGLFVTRTRMPDLTILMDLPAQVGLFRAKRKDRMEKKSIEFHKKVRDGYLRLAKLHPGRIKLVEVKSDIPHTQDKVRKIILEFLGKRIQTDLIGCARKRRPACRQAVIKSV